MACQNSLAIPSACAMGVVTPSSYSLNIMIGDDHDGDHDVGDHGGDHEGDGHDDHDDDRDGDDHDDFGDDDVGHYSDDKDIDNNVGDDCDVCRVVHDRRR